MTAGPGPIFVAGTGWNIGRCFHVLHCNHTSPHTAEEGAQLLHSPLRSVAISPPIKSGERTPLIDHKRTGWMCGAQPSQPQAAFTDGNTATATPPRLLQAHTREPSNRRA